MAIIPIPLKIDIETKKIPLVTISLIIINSLIFGLCIYFGNLDEIRNSYGLVPKNIGSCQKLYTLITSMFLHANISHIIGNMWFLWLFGVAIEDICGKARYILLYFICGLVGGLLAVLVDPSFSVAIVGASGAISGLIGASMLMLPYANTKCLHPLWFLLLMHGARKLTINIPVVLWAVVWLIYQVVWIFIVASFNVVHFGYLAHLGGFFAGLFLINFFVISRPVSREEKLEIESRRVIKPYVPKSAGEIFKEKQEAVRGASPAEERPKPLYIRCKKCGEIIKITSSERGLQVKCPKCGAEGKIKIS